MLETAEVDTRKLASFLEKVKLFEMMTPSERDDLVKVLHPVAYEKGATIIKEGDTGTDAECMFVLFSGHASVSTEEKGQVARVKPGGHFGELSLVTHEPRVRPRPRSCLSLVC